MSDGVLRILLIEDNAADARLIRDMFRTEPPGSFELTHVQRMSEGVERLTAGNIDIALVDMGLPDEHGLATVRRAKAAAPCVPVIVFTGLDDEALAGEAMHAGAEDYLIKGQIESRALPRALRHAIERRRLQAEADLSRAQQVQLKEEFLSHVSHELRSPLTAIYQFVTILLDGLSGDLNPRQHDNLAIILKNVEQLRAMIDDLLEISRAQAGTLIVASQSMSLADAITYATHTLKATAALKSITLATMLECQLPQVYADPTRVRQVLVALLDNAIKFTPVGGSVSVQAAVREGSRQFVTLQVADSGCGVRPDVIDLIFERQFQADPEMEGRRGLGLGLYICKELISRQGGHISVTNAPDHGAVFSITIPIVSLADQIVPFLSNELDGMSPADSVGLICVESRADNGWPHGEARAEWSRQSRLIIQQCLLQTSYQLLPRLELGGTTEMSFVITFSGHADAAAMTASVRAELKEAVLSQHLRTNIFVSHQLVDGMPTEDASAQATAVNIAAMIHTYKVTRLTTQ